MTHQACVNQSSLLRKQDGCGIHLCFHLKLIVAILNSLFHDLVCRSVLVQGPQLLQEVVEAGSSALLLLPMDQQLMDRIREISHGIYHIVANIQASEEPPDIFEVHLIKILETPSSEIVHLNTEGGKVEVFEVFSRQYEV